MLQRHCDANGIKINRRGDPQGERTGAAALVQDSSTLIQIHTDDTVRRLSALLTSSARCQLCSRSPVTVTSRQSL